MIEVEIDRVRKLSAIRRISELRLYWPPPVSSTSSLLERLTNRPWRAAIYYLLSKFLQGVILLMLWVVSYWPLPLYPILVCLAILALAAYFSMWFADRSERWSRKLIRQDPRSAIVCLRAFRDDAKNSDPADSGFFPNPITLIQRRVAALNPKNKFGVHLNARLSSYGPLITLANPALHLPVVGPNEVSVINEKWQEEVLFHLDRACLIIIFAGVSTGLCWELNQIMARGLLYRTVLLIPPNFMRTEVEILKELVNLSKTQEGDSSAVPDHLKEYVDLLPLLRELTKWKEFEEFDRVSIDETLLIRWAGNGEPILIKGQTRTHETILQALDLCIEFSTGSRVETMKLTFVD